MATRILIIDNEPKWIDFARDNLGMIFEVEVATDLVSALVKLKEERYELIIANSRYLDVLKMINEKYPEKRVVVATGQPNTREAINAYRLGVFDYFAKDFRPEVISEKIFAAIQKPIKASV